MHSLRSLVRFETWIRAGAWLCLLQSSLAAGGSATPELSSAPDDPFEGVWRGTVVAPSESTEIGFAFTRADGGLVASFYMPEMFVYGMELGPAEVNGDTYTFQPLDTTLKRTGDKLIGTFGLAKLPVELRRGDPFPPAPPRRELPAAPKPVWSRSLGARVWASPVVSEGIVYVGCTDGTCHAIRAKDGKDLWNWKGPHPLYGQALVDDGSVYFVDDSGALTSLDRKDGHLRWNELLHDETLPSASASKDVTFNHRTPVPVIAKGILYVGSTDNGIYAVEGAFGKTLWRHDAQAPIYAGVTVLGSTLIAGCYDGSVFKLDLLTRKETVRVKLPGPVVSTPVVAGDRVVVGCRNYLLYGLELTNMAVAWRDAYWFSWVESTPCLVDGLLYIGASDYRRVSAIDPANGKRLWATDVRGLTWGTPALTDDTVFAGTSAQSTAVIPHEGGLMALDRKTGAVKWRAVVPLSKAEDRAGYIGSPVLGDGLVIAAGVDGTLVAYPAR